MEITVRVTEEIIRIVFSSCFESFRADSAICEAIGQELKPGTMIFCGQEGIAIYPDPRIEGRESVHVDLPEDVARWLKIAPILLQDAREHVEALDLLDTEWVQSRWPARAVGSIPTITFDMDVPAEYVDGQPNLKRVL